MPDLISSHRSSGVVTSPGNRQPIATTATGSPATSAGANGGADRATAARPPSTSARSQAASTWGVG